MVNLCVVVDGLLGQLYSGCESGDSGKILCAWAKMVRDIDDVRYSDSDGDIPGLQQRDEADY